MFILLLLVLWSPSMTAPSACRLFAFFKLLYFQRRRMPQAAFVLVFSFFRGEHVPETAEYGITSFVFRSQHPFHPQRLESCVQSFLPWSNPAMNCVVRSKGVSWIATPIGYIDICCWSQAGAVFQMAYQGHWLATST